MQNADNGPASTPLWFLTRQYLHYSASGLPSHPCTLLSILASTSHPPIKQLRRRVYVKLWLLFTLTSSALAKSDPWLHQTLHTHIFCIGKVRFRASLTTSGLPCCHRCNLSNQPINTPYQALTWIHLPRMISAGNTEFSFNSSVLSHGRQIIKHITGVNFNPEEKRTSNHTNNMTLVFTIISRHISNPNCNINQSNQEIGQLLVLLIIP